MMLLLVYAAASCMGAAMRQWAIAAEADGCWSPAPTWAMTYAGIYTCSTAMLGAVLAAAVDDDGTAGRLSVQLAAALTAAHCASPDNAVQERTRTVAYSKSHAPKPSLDMRTRGMTRRASSRTTATDPHAKSDWQVRRSARSERDDRVIDRPRPTRWRREEHTFRRAVEQYANRQPRAETYANRRARRVPESVTASAIRAPASRARNRTPGTTSRQRPRAARGGARPRRYATTGARNGTPDGRPRRRRARTKPTFVERRTKAPKPQPGSAPWCATPSVQTINRDGVPQPNDDAENRNGGDHGTATDNAVA